MRMNQKLLFGWIFQLQTSLVSNEWKDNHVYLTELVMVLNHKIWQWYETNDAIARLYDTLWREADLWAQENLKDEELEYFYRVTD